VSEHQESDCELVEVLWKQFQNPDASVAIDLIDELARRMALQDDQAMATWIGDVLLSAANQLATVSGGSEVRVWGRLLELQLTALEERAKRVRPQGPSDAALGSSAAPRPGPRSATSRSWMGRCHDLRRRVAHAVGIYDLLIQRFSAEPDPAVRRIAVSARLHRGAVLLFLGRYRAAAREIEGWFAIDEDSIAAVLQAARPSAGGGYSGSDRAAALLANGVSIGGRPGSQQTLMRIEEILLAGLSDRRANFARRWLRLDAGPRPQTPPTLRTP
jgi:hypothetical protein